MHGHNHFKLSSIASHKLWTCFSQHWDWTIYRDFSITNSAIGNLTTSSFDHVSISRNCWGCRLCVHVCSCVHICYTHVNTGVCGFMSVMAADGKLRQGDLCWYDASLCYRVRPRSACNWGPFLRHQILCISILADRSKCLLLVVALFVLPQALERENPIRRYRWDTELDS